MHVYVQCVAGVHSEAQIPIASPTSGTDRAAYSLAPTHCWTWQQVTHASFEQDAEKVHIHYIAH